MLAAIEEMDLSAFYGAYRQDGHGRAAHDPAMMVALLLYAYARGHRSSRVIERACIEDVAYRVIAANQVPDHSTIARFRQRHEAALAGLFSEVLALCADAGLVDVAVLAIDGTKLHADASRDSTRDYDQIAAEILAEADAVDRAEDEQFGEARGDELPAQLSTHQGRRGWLRDATSPWAALLAGWGILRLLALIPVVVPSSGSRRRWWDWEQWPWRYGGPAGQARPPGGPSHPLRAVLHQPPDAGGRLNYSTVIASAAPSATLRWPRSRRPSL